ncbi:isochorismatase hydrolase [Halteromyces radiatus]|uniref:isochorismatase hydrolase n=1 Tax=Halteromyces radiatus TaxID=101107 RepID=UPI00221EAABA|nr:isochorismatase hydrolase [Halteromyces radiatus]KAI8083148.1 isochorismatase hydrolase [Halteromyces radiatus]
MMTSSAHHSKIALVLVDIQYDFLESGSLPVPEASHIIPNVQQLITFVQARQGLIIATQDWHPSNHTSFASNHTSKRPFDTIQLNYNDQSYIQVLWPDHCVQHTPGAELVQDIQSAVQIIVQKGTNPDVDSYSGFADNQYHEITSLAKHLYQHTIDTVIVCGLAADYCVKMTCLDALKFGFKTILVKDATRAVIPDHLDQTLQSLIEKGIMVAPSTQALISDPTFYHLA